MFITIYLALGVAYAIGLLLTDVEEEEVPPLRTLKSIALELMFYSLVVLFYPIIFIARIIYRLSSRRRQGMSDLVERVVEGVCVAVFILGTVGVLLLIVSVNCLLTGGVSQP